MGVPSHLLGAAPIGSEDLLTFQILPPITSFHCTPRFFKLVPPAVRVFLVIVGRNRLRDYGVDLFYLIIYILFYYIRAVLFHPLLKRIDASVCPLLGLSSN